MSEAVLRAKLTADDAEFQRKMHHAIETGKEFGHEVGKAAKEAALELAEILAVAESVKFAFEGVVKAFELGDSMRNLSLRTGIAVDEAQRLSVAFKMNGSSAEAVGPMINKMQKALEGVNDAGEKTEEMLDALEDKQAHKTVSSKVVKQTTIEKTIAVDPFERIGLDAKALSEMNPDEAFIKIQKAIAGIENPAQRAQAAMAIFGRTGGEMLSLFANSGAMDEAARALGSQSEILNANAENFKKISDLMQAAGLKIQGFFVGMAEPISQVLLPVLDKLDDIDLAGIGQKFGRSISASVTVIYNAFSNGVLGELFGDAFRYGAAVGGNYLVGAVKTAGDVFATALKDIFSLKFGLAFGDLLVGAAGMFGASLMRAFQGPLKFFDDAVAYMANRIADVILVLAGGLASMLSKVLGPILRGIDKLTGTNLANGLEAAGSAMLSEGRAHSETMEDFSSFQRDRKDKSAFGIDPKSIAQGAQDLLKKGAGEMSSTLSGISQDLKGDFAGFKPSELFDTSNPKRNFDDLIKGLLKPFATAGEGKASESFKVPTDVESKQKREVISKSIEGVIRIGGMLQVFNPNSTGLGILSRGGGLADKVGSVFNGQSSDRETTLKDIYKQLVVIDGTLKETALA